MISDKDGNTLTGFQPTLPEHVPAALVVVTLDDSVLMIFDSWRRHWELPGGSLDPGETPAAAAERELHEETGIRGAALTFATAADFDLRHPDRREALAVYRTELQSPPRLVVNDEALDFLWWRPSTPVPADMSPLDAEIARHVTGVRP